MRSGKIFSTKVRYSYKSECGLETTPKFNPSIFQIKPSYIDEVLGLGLTLPETKGLLKRMGYKVVRADSVNDILVLEIPFYRKDIMHAVDIVEDVAIAYNYDSIPPLEPKIPTNGGLMDETERDMLIKEIMIGMKFQEVLSFTLASKEILFGKMGSSGEAINIINPISSNYACLRNSILPMLMKFLEINKTVEFPHLLL
jgi:phenylalanyl-tRNA synthetase beta chain